jgi:hypothetical protein
MSIVICSDYLKIGIKAEYSAPGKRIKPRISLIHKNRINDTMVRFRGWSEREKQTLVNNDTHAPCFSIGL